MYLLIPSGETTRQSITPVLVGTRLLNEAPYFKQTSLINRRHHNYRNLNEQKRTPILFTATICASLTVSAVNSLQRQRATLTTSLGAPSRDRGKVK